MKKIILFIILLGTITFGYAQQTYVPDDNFENYLETHDANGNVVVIGATNSIGNGIANDDYVTTANINTVTNLYVDNQNIADLTGMEDFVSLTQLTCTNNQLTSLDVSTNIALVKINCRLNQLTSLTIAPNNTLEELYCSFNQLTSLDVSSNTALEYLWCIYNNLTSLNLDNCSSMSQLRTENNQLTSLDLTTCIVINEAHLQNNQLNSLNIKTGTNVNYAPNWLNITNNPNLFCVEIDSDSYVGIGWSTGFNYSENCHYTETYVPDDNFENYLETHDENGNVVAIGAANSMGNGIANDDYVTTANINTVPSLDVSSKTIADLTGIEDFVVLTQLYCANNQLTSLDFSQNTALINLYAPNNQLTSLNITQNTMLIYLYCFNNQLASLDVSQNTALTHLFCFNNQLTSLDLTLNTVFTDLLCFGNQLNSLNVKNGNNINFNQFNATLNPNLTCIEVDDTTYSTTNWTNIDATSTFVNNQAECAALITNDFVLDNITIYPNPTSDLLHINLKNTGNYSIYNIKGQLLKIGTFDVGDTTLDISDLSVGLYLIKTTTEGNTSLNKILKK